MVSVPLANADAVREFDAIERLPVAAAPARAALIAALVATPDETPCWTWAADQHVGFVTRFQATEALIHRVDAEQAAGLLVEIDPTAAAESIDVFLTHCHSDSKAGAQQVGGSVHLHCTDTEGEWLMAVDGTVTRAHAKGDVAIRGRAADIVLALWRRVPLSACQVIGDVGVAERFIASADLS